MDMKGHILSALQEMLVEWKDLLAKLSEEQFTIPLEPSQWSIKDNLVHLYAWQLRTKARVTAALLDAQPEYPAWPEDPEGDVEKINAWIYETYSDNPWQDVILKWERQYQVILEEASKIPEKDLLDTDKYAWLKGYSVAVYLLGTCDHHREHLETILAWLEQQ